MYLLHSICLITFLSTLLIQISTVERKIMIPISRKMLNCISDLADNQLITGVLRHAKNSRTKRRWLNSEEIISPKGQRWSSSYKMMWEAATHGCGVTVKSSEFTWLLQAFSPLSRSGWRAHEASLPPSLCAVNRNTTRPMIVLLPVPSWWEQGRHTIPPSGHSLWQPNMIWWLIGTSYSSNWMKQD